MGQAAVFIRPARSDKVWKAALTAVKVTDEWSPTTFRFFADMALFEGAFPHRIIVATNDGIVIAHSEIRDLGTDPVSNLEIAGLSNTIVAEPFRQKGIYTALIRVRNLILDDSPFDYVAARVKSGYEKRYMAQHRDFLLVKLRDALGAAWLLRPTPRIPLNSDDIDHIIKYLETEVKKW